MGKSLAKKKEYEVFFISGVICVSFCTMIICVSLLLLLFPRVFICLLCYDRFQSSILVSSYFFLDGGGKQRELA